MGGQSSTGIEVKKLYHYLLNRLLHFQVLTAYSDTFSDHINTLPIVRNRIPRILKKIAFILWGIDLDSTYLKRHYQDFLNSINKKSNTFIIHGFTSSTDFYVINLCQDLKRHLGKQCIEGRMHFFDPIPAKEHWGEFWWLRKAKIRYTKKRISNEFEWTAASGPMCDYLGKIYSVPCGVNYSSVEKQTLNFSSKINDNKKRAYYMGSIYGQRTGKFLFEAFANQELWELHIYGNNPVIEWKNVYFHEYCSDLSSLKEPDLLIDLDVDQPDVYIPGKSYTYLNTNIPILCISHEDSALRNFYALDVKKLEDSHNQELGIYFVNNDISCISSMLWKLQFSEAKNLDRVALRDNINQLYFGRKF